MPKAPSSSTHLDRLRAAALHAMTIGDMHGTDSPQLRDAQAKYEGIRDEPARAEGRAKAPATEPTTVPEQQPAMRWLGFRGIVVALRRLMVGYH